MLMTVILFLTIYRLRIWLVKIVPRANLHKENVTEKELIDSKGGIWFGLTKIEFVLTLLSRSAPKFDRIGYGWRWWRSLYNSRSFAMG